jgi:uncharacterized membrane protein YozB (DUF420 family)
LTAVLFTYGWRLAVHKNISAHQKVQNLAVVLNSLVVLLALVGIFIKQYLPAIPGNIKNLAIALPAVHGMTGSFGLLYGIYVAMVGNGSLPQKIRFKNFKLFMRIAFGFYLLLTVSGIILYLTLYGVW